MDGGLAEQVGGVTALDGTQRDAGVTPRSDAGDSEERMRGMTGGVGRSARESEGLTGWLDVCARWARPKGFPPLIFLPF